MAEPQTFGRSGDFAGGSAPGHQQLIVEARNPRHGADAVERDSVNEDGCGTASNGPAASTLRPRIEPCLASAVLRTPARSEPCADMDSEEGLQSPDGSGSATPMRRNRKETHAYGNPDQIHRGRETQPHYLPLPRPLSICSTLVFRPACQRKQLQRETEVQGTASDGGDEAQYTICQEPLGESRRLQMTQVPRHARFPRGMARFRPEPIAAGRATPLGPKARACFAQSAPRPRGPLRGGRAQAHRPLVQPARQNIPSKVKACGIRVGSWNRSYRQAARLRHVRIP